MPDENRVDPSASKPAPLIKRETRMTPGWDCRNAECVHTPKGDHGIHGDEFEHAVIAEASDGRLCALVITISTNRYPPTVSDSARRREPSSGAGLTIHIQGPKPEDGKAYRRGFCEWTNNSLCETTGFTILGASELWKAVPEIERDPEKPGESFWQAMEARLRTYLVDPDLFEQPDESWELRYARERLVESRRAYREAAALVESCEQSFEHFKALYLAQRNRS